VLLSEPAGPLLTPWGNFYVIVGSSAGALTGLQFVVIALIAEIEMASSILEIRAFGSPTVVHFCAALLISAIMSAPWASISGTAVALGACGAAGLIYAMTVIKHALRQTGYAPDTEDWFWYVASPLLGYAALLGGAILFVWYGTLALFVIAGTALLLLFIGIHNSWDTVTYIATGHGQPAKKDAAGK
jgi:hypothetical protein